MLPARSLMQAGARGIRISIGLLNLSIRANRNRVRRDSRVHLVVNETLPHAAGLHKIGSILGLKGHYYAAVRLTSTRCRYYHHYHHLSEWKPERLTDSSQRVRRSFALHLFQSCIQSRRYLQLNDTAIPSFEQTNSTSTLGWDLKENNEINKIPVVKFILHPVFHFIYLQDVYSNHVNSLRIPEFSRYFY